MDTRAPSLLGPSIPPIANLFCNLNFDKLNLVRMTFIKGRDHHGNRMLKRKMITRGDINGKRFTAINTLWGEGLIDFHHRLLTSVSPDLNPENEFSWIQSKGSSPAAFYPIHLARFICHGVLFESYLGTGHEADFVEDVVRPAFNSVHSLFGIKPLIVRLLPQESEEDPSWNWYEGTIENIVEDAFNNSRSIPDYHATRIPYAPNNI
jgi:hypothetical protein